MQQIAGDSIENREMPAKGTIKLTKKSATDGRRLVDVESIDEPPTVTARSTTQDYEETVLCR